MLGVSRPQECRHHSYLSVGLRNVPFSPHLAKESRASSRCLVKAALSQDPPSRCCIFSDETDKQSLYVRFSLSKKSTTFPLAQRHGADNRPSDGNCIETRGEFRRRRWKSMLSLRRSVLWKFAVPSMRSSSYGGSSILSTQSIKRVRYSQGGNDRA